MNTNSITGRIPKSKRTNFSLEVHVFAGTLVPIVSTTLGGSAANRYHTPNPPQEAPQEPTHK
jgi:hypothetical protein